MPHPYMDDIFDKFRLDSRSFSEAKLRLRVLKFMLLFHVTDSKNHESMLSFYSKDSKNHKSVLSFYSKDPLFLPFDICEKIKDHYMPFVTLSRCESYQKLPLISQRWYSTCFKDEIDRKYKSLSTKTLKKISDMGLYEYIDMLKHRDRFILDFNKLNECEKEYRGGGPPRWSMDLIALLMEGSFIDFKNTVGIIKIFSELLDFKDKIKRCHKESYIAFFQKYTIFFQILFDRLFYIMDTSIKDYKIVRIEDKLRLCITCYVSPDYEMITKGKKQRNVGLRRFTGYSIERVEKMSIKPEVMFYSNTILEHDGKMYFKIFDSEKFEGYNYQGAYVPEDCVEY